jgi:hypothetical protein
MVWLVDDVAEAALGPWGLAVGLGVGAVVLARKHLAPVASTAAVNGLEAADRAREWAGGLEGPGKVAGWLGGLAVAERARTAAAEVGDWWSDLYAEARAEWEAGRNDISGAETSVAAATERLERAATKRPRRGAGGRFAKSTEDTA